MVVWAPPVAAPALPAVVPARRAAALPVSAARAEVSGLRLQRRVRPARPGRRRMRRATGSSSAVRSWDLTSGSGCDTAERRSLPGCVRRDPITVCKARHPSSVPPRSATDRPHRSGAVWWTWAVSGAVAMGPPDGTRMGPRSDAERRPWAYRSRQAPGHPGRRMDGATDSSIHGPARQAGSALIRRSGRGIPAAGRTSYMHGAR